VFFDGPLAAPWRTAYGHIPEREAACQLPGS
jgi:hypothetical protein